jgi:CBS domain-containing protein
LYKDVREAYDFINLLRISHHLKARSKGELPDNFVDPEKLNNLQRRMLKESFAVINRLLQELIEWRYQVHTLEEA